MNCLRCEGKGTRPDILHEGRDRPCYQCNGTGTFEPLTSETIANLCDSLMVNRKGKRTFRTSPPNTFRNRKDTFQKRLYYIWRMARFHGGIDMHMPMEAMMVIEGDPERKTLDIVADKVAKEVFGSDMRAAKTWGGALGYL